MRRLVAPIHHILVLLIPIILFLLAVVATAKEEPQHQGAQALHVLPDDCSQPRSRRHTQNDAQFLRCMARMLTSPIEQDNNNDAASLRKLLPWLVPDARDLRKGFHGRGVVLTVANDHVPTAYAALRRIRALDNTIPIQILHRSDLDPRAAALLKDAIPGVTLKNFDALIHPQYRPHITGFRNKPFAVLFSDFDETIVVDADTVLVEPPDTLFALDAYRTSGMLLFRDRHMPHYTANKYKWVRSLLDPEILTNFTLQNPFLHDHVRHLAEAGVILIRKSDFFPGLLATCDINLWPETYHYVYGDKETFWIGQAIVGNEAYRFHYLSVAGIGAGDDYYYSRHRILMTHDTVRLPTPEFLREHRPEVCSAHPAHVTFRNDNRYLDSTTHELSSTIDPISVDHRDVQLLWLNGGLLKCKYDFLSDDQLQPLEVLYIPLRAAATRWTKPLGCGGNLYCLQRTNTTLLHTLPVPEARALYFAQQQWRDDHETARAILSSTMFGNALLIMWRHAPYNMLLVLFRNTTAYVRLVLLACATCIITLRIRVVRGKRALDARSAVH